MDKRERKREREQERKRTSFKVAATLI